MVKYSFELELKGTNEKYGYAVELSQNWENRPEGFFTREVREEIRLDLQRQSSCLIDNIALNSIVQTWIQDIKEGYRNSSIALELTPMNEASLGHLSDSGNQEIPPILYPDIAEIEPMGGALPPLVFG